MFNDLVVLAPGAIIDAPVRWTAIDTQHVRGAYTDGDQIVAAVLTLSASTTSSTWSLGTGTEPPPTARPSTNEFWSTPLAAYRLTDGRHLPTVGEGRWNAPEPEGSFTYVEFHIDDIHYNIRSAG